MRRSAGPRPGTPQPLRELLGRARQGHDSISAICRRIGERCAELTYAEHGIAHAPRESEEFALLAAAGLERARAAVAGDDDPRIAALDAQLVWDLERPGLLGERLCSRSPLPA